MQPSNTRQLCDSVLTGGDRRQFLRRLGIGATVGLATVAGGTSASGSSGVAGAAESSLPHTVEITKNEPEVPESTVSYEFAVTGSLEAGPDIEQADSIDGSTARGGMGPVSGADTYRYSGLVTSFSLSGDARVYVDGDRVDPDARHTITVSKTDDSLPDGDVAYEFTVDGPVQAGSSVEGNDTIDGSRVTGGMGPETGVDRYTVWGSIERFDLSGAADVLLDGAEVDPSNLGAPGHHLLVDRAPESAGQVDYIVETDGHLAAGGHRGPGTINSNDIIYGATAQGQVRGGTDPYVVRDASWIEVTSAGGDLRTTLDGEVVDLNDRTSLEDSDDEEESPPSDRDKRGELVSFDDGTWRETLSSHHPENLSTVGTPSVSGRALAVEIAGGQHHGINSRYPMDDPDEAWAQYYVYFDEDWDYGGGRGGKQPGFAGTYGEAGWGGRPTDGTNGWSARMVHDPSDDGRPHVGFYVYHVDMNGTYGSNWKWDAPTGVLSRGEWYRIDQHLRLNTPGEADGLLEGWVDGAKAFERGGLRFRAAGHGDIAIEEFWLNNYWGGSWESPSTNHQYFDELRVSTEGPVSRDLE